MRAPRPGGRSRRGRLPAPRETGAPAPATSEGLDSLPAPCPEPPPSSIGPWSNRESAGPAIASAAVRFRVPLLLVLVGSAAAAADPPPRIGLVLGGGGARGGAHIGVLRVMEELHVPVDYV